MSTEIFRGDQIVNIKAQMLSTETKQRRTMSGNEQIDAQLGLGQAIEHSDHEDGSKVEVSPKLPAELSNTKTGENEPSVKDEYQVVPQEPVIEEHITEGQSSEPITEEDGVAINEQTSVIEEIEHKEAEQQVENEIEEPAVKDEDEDDDEAEYEDDEQDGEEDDELGDETGDNSRVDEESAMRSTPTPESPKVFVPAALPQTLEKSLVEEEHPENTPESPEATIYKAEKAELQQHTRYVRSFPKNPYPKPVKNPLFTDPERLTSGQDEYEVLERSPKGEQKVTDNGYLLGGRKYLFNTFTLPGRGRKLFALATEAAKVLNFRDAFLLCTRTKQLMRYATVDEERKFLEETGILQKIRNRVVGVIAARALYLNFNARVIMNGKRVVDDYWEENAIEQGFTEKDQVFPVDKNYGPRAGNHHKRDPVKQRVIIPVVSSAMLVHPIPSLEERREYLTNSSRGDVTQVLPGQGITGGVELTAFSTVPKYTTENNGVRADAKPANKAITSLMMDSAPIAVAPSGGLNKLPINDELAGDKSSMGLPFYKRNVVKRALAENAENLREVEYLHSTVVLNNHINIIRTQRNRQWPYYWQTKAGVELRLTKENAEDYLMKKEEFLKHEEVQTQFNEYLNCDQVMTKRRRPNPNYIGHSNLDGVKPPYIEKPISEAEAEQRQAMAAFAMQPQNGSVPGYMQQQQHAVDQRFAQAQAHSQQGLYGNIR